MEQKKPTYPHGKGQGTERQCQIAPTHVIFFGTAGFSMADQAAGLKVRVAGVILKEGPTEETSSMNG